MSVVHTYTIEVKTNLFIILLGQASRCAEWPKFSMGSDQNDESLLFSFLKFLMFDELIRK